MNITGNLNGETVTIVSQQGSGDQIYTSYLTSAGALNISRKNIGIDDLENVSTNSSATDFYFGSDGDIVNVVRGQKIYQGNKIWSWNVIKTADDYSTNTITATSAETNIFTSATVGRNGLTPVITANFLKASMANTINFRVRGGLNLTTGVNVLTYRVYCGPTLVAQAVMDQAKMPLLLSAYNDCTEVCGWFETISYVSPGTSARVRSHTDSWVKQSGASNNYVAYETNREVYSNINTTIDNGIRITAQWNNPGNICYIDGVEIWI